MRARRSGTGSWPATRASRTRRPASPPSPSGCTSSSAAATRSTPRSSRRRERYVTVQRPAVRPRRPGAACCCPLAFCRECGQEYYSVRSEPRADGAGEVYVARASCPTARPTTAATPASSTSAPTDPWPDDAGELLDRVPDDWLEEHRGGRARQVRPTGKYLPAAVRVDPDGRLTRDGRARRPLRARAVPLLPALRRLLRRAVSRPTSASSPTLGSGGRSTRHDDPGPGRRPQPAAGRDRSTREARKLLSFTDNRQDASLQAGHFNDFVEIGLLRVGPLPGRRRGGRGRAAARRASTQKVFDALGSADRALRRRTRRPVRAQRARDRRRCATSSATASTAT